MALAEGTRKGVDFGDNPKTTYRVRGVDQAGQPMTLYHRSSFKTLMARMRRLGMVRGELVEDLHGFGPPPAKLMGEGGVGSTAKRTLKVKA